MNQALIKELTWVLMLIPVGIILGVGVYYLCRTVQRVRLERKFHKFAPAVSFDDTEPEEGGTPSLGLSPFEQPCRWLAIRGESLSTVQAALNLHHVVQCSWEEGLVEAQEDKVFLSPPLAGWILVVGSGLPDPAEDVDRCYLFLAELSRKLGIVQFYNSNHVLNHHAWVTLEKGIVNRAYAWADEVLWNQGPMTAAERDLEMKCFDYGAQTNFAHRETLANNSERVIQLAARWSIDPSVIAEATSKHANGIVGEFSHVKPH